MFCFLFSLELLAIPLCSLVLLLLVCLQHSYRIKMPLSGALEAREDGHAVLRFVPSGRGKASVQKTQVWVENNDKNKYFITILLNPWWDWPFLLQSRREREGFGTGSCPFFRDREALVVEQVRSIGCSYFSFLLFKIMSYFCGIMICSLKLYL